MVKVLKFGGSSLKNAKDFRNVAEIIKKEEDKPIVILSGVFCVTDIIQKYLNYEKIDEIAIQGIIHHLRRLHHRIASEAITDIAINKKVQITINDKLEKLEKMFRGIYYIDELTARTKDLILSYGERLSVPILAGILNDNNIKAQSLEADSLGILTNGDFGNAVAILNPIVDNLNKKLAPLIDRDIIPIITGFFGCDNNGRTTLFGRNGSDYSASVVAYAVNATEVDIWKDVDGFLSADPSIIKNANLLSDLSYSEAAELSYFGAKILHPRTVEPLIQKEIELKIKNTYNPSGIGTTIGNNGHKKKSIKSVAYSRDIACIKIHGPGVGYKPGVLSEIASCLSQNKINIKSVITSQTCITLLLEKKDLIRGFNMLTEKNVKTVKQIEKIEDIALVAVVGEGILNNNGVVAKVFNAISQKGINIELLSAGASEVAYYFIIKENLLEPTLKAIHNELIVEN